MGQKLWQHMGLDTWYVLWAATSTQVICCSLNYRRRGEQRRTLQESFGEICKWCFSLGSGSDRAVPSHSLHGRWKPICNWRRTHVVRQGSRLLGLFWFLALEITPLSPSLLRGSCFGGFRTRGGDAAICACGYSPPMTLPNWIFNMRYLRRWQ